MVELELARRFDRDKELVVFFEALFDRPLSEESLEGGLLLRSSLWLPERCSDEPAAKEERLPSPSEITGVAVAEREEG